ncbi:hypothetical protein K461DRAFT_272663 [Myriangium duriaei CBS 260.36]|uniref:Transglutaminase-like domain-containing protein n=1 Tax=Myriangium duriaei CBS 260.36 TaxID=1168546 RepID=A0A9P4J760_9PEZI|nr:hypothetical protein K461DRAFT_272663 [Myriangium duriaei CBS 260.36]
MAEETGPTSIADRIAALKLNQVGRQAQSPPPSYEQATATTNGATRRPPPALPNRRTESTQALVTTGGIGNQPAASPAKVSVGKPAPALPPRRPTSNTNGTPALPPRRPSESPSLPARTPSAQLSRKDSRESIASTVSNYSIASNKTGISSRTTSSGQTYTIRAPSFDPSTLPPLPPKRTNDQAPDKTPRVSLSKTVSTPSLPQRPALPQRHSTLEPPPEPARRTEPPPPRKSALLQGFGPGNDKPPIVPSTRPGRENAPPPALGRPSFEPQDSVPPPVPAASRPDLSQLKLSKPKAASSSALATSTPQAGSCLRCRDFSGPDNHAARFPRESIPTQEPAWLAHQLTSPFTSDTDKARAIFAWLHYNIRYNTVAFFNNAVKPSTPNSTISTGLAVCEGYAALFTALAVMSGLESRVIGGHGKGYGYAPVAPGQAVPPFEAGHAWNVVRIDDGEWKLIDPCWGAGHLNCADNTYKQSFTPSQFTMSNEDFGETHFPEDRQSFYRTIMPNPSWEDYLLGADRGGETVQTFGGFTWEEGIAAKSISPRPKRISLAAERQKGFSRFSFTKVCAHWDNERQGKGKPYCYILCRDGQQAVPFQSNGYAWWIDIPADELGQPGQEIKIGAVNKFNGGDGRGVTNEEFLARRGRVAMGWGFMCLWTLAA